jgi:hypothetical protein
MKQTTTLQQLREKGIFKDIVSKFDKIIGLGVIYNEGIEIEKEMKVNNDTIRTLKEQISGAMNARRFNITQKLEKLIEKNIALVKKHQKLLPLMEIRQMLTQNEREFEDFASYMTSVEEFQGFSEHLTQTLEGVVKQSNKEEREKQLDRMVDTIRLDFYNFFSELVKNPIDFQVDVNKDVIEALPDRHPVSEVIGNIYENSEFIEEDTGVYKPNSTKTKTQRPLTLHKPQPKQPRF